MKRLSTILVAAVAAAAAARAQDGPPPPPPEDGQEAVSPATGASDAAKVVLAPKAPTPAPPPAADEESGRSVSAKLAADLASDMPKYSPPTPTPTVTDVPKDLRDIDKPRNEIHRLPAYIVRESRPAVFRERDLYTPAGLADLSLKRHPGLILGNYFGLNSGIAYQMYLDDLRLAEMQDLNDTAHAMSLGGDKAESDYIMKESQATFMRPIEETWNGPGGGGGFSGGGGR